MLLLGCAAAKPRDAVITVRAETPDGEPLQDALRRIEPDVGAPIGVVLTTESPPPRIPVHAIRRLPLAPLRAPLPCYVSLTLGERAFETRAVSGAADVVFKVEPEEILRALPTVRVRFVAKPEDVAVMGPDLASSATWDERSNPRLLDVRGGSCEIRRAVPGEGLLWVSGPCALAMMRIDVAGTSDIDLELPLVRPAPVSGRVEGPPMTDSACDVYALLLDDGFPPPPLGLAPHCPAFDGDGAFSFGSSPRGRQVLIVRKRGYAIGWAEADNTRGPVDDVRIPLRPGVEIKLKTARSGLDAPYVQVETEDGLPLYAHLLVSERDPPPVLTLSPGRYVLRHRTCNGPWHARPLTVANEPIVAWIR
ncbi:MAG: hypothetical protein L0206_18680 [Actinobacteria bacterium]|nr:hypothetical protein [Actinomycetota bacterium]